MKPSPRVAKSPRRAGSILLLVLVALVALTLGTGAYLALMQNEHLAVRRHGRQQQCMALAESGVAYVESLLLKTDQDLLLAGGPLNNAASLQGVLVAEGATAMDRGRFSVVAPAQLSGVYSGYQFGLQDESSKLNLNALITPARGGQGAGLQGAASPGADGGNNSGGGNAAGAAGNATGAGGASASGGAPANGSSGGNATAADPRERLLALPGMTVEVADAILDWLDEDTAARANGAEAEYYQSLDPPYAPANGPLTSLDQLLQVRGVTPELLYGLDQNRNLVVDANEMPRGALVDVDNSTGEMNLGWAAYLTVDGVESFRTADGAARANLNDQNLQTLYGTLSETLTDEQAKFLILARQYGLQAANAGGTQPGGAGGGQPNAGAPGQPGGAAGGPGGGANQVKAAAVTLDFTQKPQANIGSLLDLVGATVQVPGGDNQQPQTVVSPWQDNAGSYADLLKLYDAATTATGRVGGRVNINTAPRAVLRTIPGIDASTVEQIILRREAIYDPIAGPQRHALWLLTDSLVDLATMRKLEPYVTGGGNVFSGEVVGFYDDGGAAARLFVVIDRTDGTPRIVRREDRTTLDPGLAPVALGAQLDEF